MPGEKILDTPSKKPIKPPSCPFATMGTVIVQIMIRQFSDPSLILNMPSIEMKCEYCKFYNKTTKKCRLETLGG